MKNVKMMLVSLALFAVVGGALAFKAKFNQNFCTAATVAGIPNTNLACKNPALLSTTDPLQQAVFVATTTYDNNQCKTTNLKCTTTSTPIIRD